jgi:hypothetical protein
MWSFPSPDLDETLDRYLENTLDLMYELDKEFIDSTKNNNQYVIGFHSLENWIFHISCPNQNSNITEFKNEFIGSNCIKKSIISKIQVFDSGISPRTFFQFSYDEIYLYLFYNSLKYCRNYKIDIIQIKIIDNVYTAIPKTFWLKIIQRKWKKIMKKRNNIILGRGTPYIQLYFQTYGKYPLNYRILPSIHGMLFNSTV